MQAKQLSDQEISIVRFLYKRRKVLFHGEQSPNKRVCRTIEPEDDEPEPVESPQGQVVKRPIVKSNSSPPPHIVYEFDQQSIDLRNLELVRDSIICWNYTEYPAKPHFVSTSANLGIYYSYGDMRTLYVLIQKPADEKNITKFHFGVNFSGKYPHTNQYFNSRVTITFNRYDEVFLVSADSHATDMNPSLIKHKGQKVSTVYNSKYFFIFAIHMWPKNYHLFNSKDQGMTNVYNFYIEYSVKDSCERQALEIPETHNSFTMFSKPHGRKSDVHENSRAKFTKLAELYKTIESMQ